jgi:hypothetical protein
VYRVPNTGNLQTPEPRKSRGSAVGTATGYWLEYEGSEFDFRYGQEFTHLHIVQALGPIQPSVQWVRGGGSYTGVKAAGEIS